MLIPSLLSSLVLLLACASPAADDELPSLDQLVNRATRFQQGSAAEIPSGSVHGRFHLKWRKPDGTGFLTFNIERTYVREPERMLTRRVDFAGQTDMSEAFDGQRSWVRNNKSGQSYVLDADPLTFETDLDAMRQQLRIMRMIHDALSVRGLITGLSLPRVEGLAKLRPPYRNAIEGDDREPDAYVVVGTREDDLFEPDLSAPPPLPGDPAPRMHLRLSFSVASGALLSMELTTMGRARPRAMQLWFANYGANAQGLVVPQGLKVLEDGVEVVSLGLATHADGTAGLTLGADYPDELFSLPGDAQGQNEDKHD
ncbi:MAG: hypothetical protein DRQ55_04445 [Planctomycetota bacterium]|nr:MAG: hypothetical protein DRQ55_04445 [Planctomycetota bacterium]